LFGIATSGVVLSTLLEASDDDFRLVVINNCFADLDLNLHDCLIDRFFPSRSGALGSRIGGEFLNKSRGFHNQEPAAQK